MRVFILGEEQIPDWLWNKIFSQEVILILKNGVYDKNTKLEVNGVVYESGSLISEELFEK